MTSIEEEIVDHLVVKWTPEVVLLGGSRATSENFIDSDWDLYLIGDYPQRKCFPEQFKGAHLDVELCPRRSVPDEIFRIFYGPISALRVLKESPDNLGARIVARTRQAYDEGPSERDQSEQEMDRVEMARVISKVITHSGDTEACFTHLGVFHRMAVQMWFERRKRWPLPAHKALPLIRREDPKFAGLLSEVAGNGEIDSKIEACRLLRKIIWGT
jgi:hypothetical protein